MNRTARTLTSVCLAMATTVAIAQPDQPQGPRRPGAAPSPSPTPTQPTPTNPATPGVNPAAPSTPAVTTPREPRPAPSPGPYITQTRPQDWLMSVRVRLRSTTARDRDAQTGLPKETAFKFQTMGVVFPLATETGSSRTYDRQIEAELRISDVVIDKEPVVLAGYAAGARLLRLDAGGTDAETTCREVELRAAIPSRSWRTEFDEKAASRVDWPKEGWPAEAMSTFQPQMYLDLGWNPQTGQIEAYDDKPLADAIDRWVKEAGGRDVKSLPPVTLAKFLAARVWASIEPSRGDGLIATTQGELAGIELAAPSMVLANGRATPSEMALLLTAVYRKAGLPARTVIGWDVGADSDRFLKKGGKQNQIRAWVEFALYDEVKNTINWVPVDIVKLRKMTSRPQSLDREWRFFGTHDELADIAVIGFQFHPPTDVVSYGSAGFWGWFVTPEPPAAAEQAISFSATTMAKRAGDTGPGERGESPSPRRGR